MRKIRHVALALFLIYLAAFPGSAAVVALDRVPRWGSWMGGALLILQGAAALFWLLGYYGRRGALAALSVFLLAWGVEHLGVVTGFPFGRYTYTEALQPQFFGIVPLPIACAWLMVATGAWQLATIVSQARLTRALLTATLVVLLDLQIETMATRIHAYWVWHDSGWYYGVPLANFVAWWLVGLFMALLLAQLLPSRGPLAVRVGTPRGLAGAAGIPAWLYLLSTLMFTLVNMMRGYPLAGLVGLVMLLSAGLWALLQLNLNMPFPASQRDAREAE